LLVFFAFYVKTSPRRQSSVYPGSRPTQPRFYDMLIPHSSNRIFLRVTSLTYRCSQLVMFNNSGTLREAPVFLHAGSYEEF